MYLSIFTGLLLGVFCAATLCNRYRSLSLCNQSTCSKKLFGSSVFSSMVRYILIAAVLGILFVRYSLNLWWWLASFMFAFWVFVILATKRFSGK